MFSLVREFAQVFFVTRCNIKPAGFHIIATFVAVDTRVNTQRSLRFLRPMVSKWSQDGGLHNRNHRRYKFFFCLCDRSRNDRWAYGFRTITTTSTIIVLRSHENQALESFGTDDESDYEIWKQVSRSMRILSTLTSYCGRFVRRVSGEETSWTSNRAAR